MEHHYTRKVQNLTDSIILEALKKEENPGVSTMQTSVAQGSCSSKKLQKWNTFSSDIQHFNSFFISQTVGVWFFTNKKQERKNLSIKVLKFVPRQEYQHILIISRNTREKLCVWYSTRNNILLPPSC